MRRAAGPGFGSGDVDSVADAIHGHYFPFLLPVAQCEAARGKRRWAAALGGTNAQAKYSMAG